MALIEIDGLPFLKMVIFHGELLNNQMVKYHSEGDQLDLLVIKTFMLFNNIHFLIHTMTMGII